MAAASLQVLTKGKHKGKSLDDVSMIDVNYLKYLKRRNVTKPDPYVTLWFILNAEKVKTILGSEKQKEPRFRSGPYEGKTFKTVMRKAPRHFINLMNKGKIVSQYPDWFEANQDEIQKIRIRHDASHGELACVDHLKKRGIKFRYEVTLPILPNKRFDFMFEHDELKYALEVDGEQHFKFSRHFHKTHEAFQKYQKTDVIKMRAAFMSGYKIIRIDYGEIGKIGYHIDQALEARKDLYLSTPDKYDYLKLVVV